ncbi:hypothetical protein SNEBB_001563 [Seison nebaliae]|nr:hypothetical protein SNEBB_001563 [Seison nebaliae]
MAELSTQTLRNAYVAKEADDQRVKDRKKKLLALVFRWLEDEGYIDTSKNLQSETSVDLRRYLVCDNIDLDIILQEYESFYFVKFKRYPKITRNSTNEQQSGKKPKHFSRRTESYRGNLPLLNNNMSKVQRAPLTSSAPRNSSQSITSSNEKKLRSVNSTNNATDLTTESKEQIKLQGVNVGKSAIVKTEAEQIKKGPIIDVRAMINDVTKISANDQIFNQLQTNEKLNDDKLIKPLGALGNMTMEMRELAQVITRDIYLESPNVKFEDIIGLESSMQVVKEAVVYPLKYPQLFSGILSPWKGLLLFGPPGTGKTMLAKAVATECNTTFFNVSASTIVSKWRGDSEKLVKLLFELARFYAPSTIFLDELDAIMSQRGMGAGGDHEGSRRMKTELLIQMDGLAKSNDVVFVLAASNLPWELDQAMLRRLEKRIHVGLPSLEAREKMFRLFLAIDNHAEEFYNPYIRTENLNFSELAQLTDGYSGSDLHLLCKEVAMNTVRKAFNQLENDFKVDNIVLDPINNDDVIQALKSTKPSAAQFQGKYKKWKENYESL